MEEEEECEEEGRARGLEGEGWEVGDDVAEADDCCVATVEVDLLGVLGEDVAVDDDDEMGEAGAVDE